MNTPPPAKKTKLLRISALTERQIAELCVILGMNQTEVITVAMDRLYAQECPPAPASEAQG